MTLLREIFERPLDPGYAAAAARRTAAGAPAARPTRAPVAVITAVLIGLLFGTAAISLRASSETRAGVRAEVIRQIESRRALADERTAAINTVSTRINQAEADALARASQGGLAADLDRLRVQTAATAVHGPGLVISLDDAPATNDAPAADTQGKVLSRDLFLVVNALWAAGAEAIAINGQRLGPRSPIRFAGAAILVNYRPLSPPYVVSAIGDPDALPAAYGSGVGAAYVKSLGDNFGIRNELTTREDIVLPAAPTGSLDSVTSTRKGGS